MNENVTPAGSTGNGEAQPSSVTDANQFEYLINENRRLQAIIDQYKYWEMNYYNAYNSAASAENNVDDSASGVLEQPTNQLQCPLPDQVQTQVQSIEISETKNPKEMERLRSELETLKKEQDDLITLLADQDLKMQSYVRRLKDLGHDVSLFLFFVVNWSAH